MNIPTFRSEIIITESWNLTLSVIAHRGAVACPPPICACGADGIGNVDWTGAERPTNQPAMEQGILTCCTRGWNHYRAKSDKYTLGIPIDLKPLPNHGIIFLGRGYSDAKVLAPPVGSSEPQPGRRRTKTRFL